MLKSHFFKKNLSYSLHSCSGTVAVAGHHDVHAGKGLLTLNTCYVVVTNALNLCTTINCSDRSGGVLTRLSLVDFLYIELL